MATYVQNQKWEGAQRNVFWYTFDNGDISGQTPTLQEDIDRGSQEVSSKITMSHVLY